MLQFGQKVNGLRSYESITYTICLTILSDETSACEAAQSVLVRLFQDVQFWELQETARRSHIMRYCLDICLSRAQSASQMVSTSNVS
ncbi:hypothetical protein I6N90_01370 [Paenibacillus sp. GSMTC-2017]|uniref:hypothetical protein n=1 Tax=Paenibacillus sp. GSMTC-2017 TaxID=2794350 RepID=UPI0018D9BF8A|nr:hypothetical protein [Paenibacillus sp. GSMTC-2017]MBH5316454.1 hypothetical protein [Paenibacillus sp. GSMTC-2017]